MPTIYKFLRFQEIHKVKQIHFIGEHSDFYIVAGFFLKNKISISGLKLYKLKWGYIAFQKTSLYLKTQILSIVIILFKAIKNAKLFSYKFNLKNKFALIHSKSSYKNIGKLNLCMTYFYDDVNLKKKPNNDAVSFYKIIGFIDYLKLIINSFILIHKVLKRLVKTSDNLIGSYGTTHAMNFFSTRIGHYILIEQSYKNIFSKYSGIEFYSGERESRYAVLAMKYANISNCFGIGVPHGIAYSYNFPLKIFGHRYFCFNQNEANFLNKTYDESKFIFDPDISNIIYENNSISQNEKKIVFFTEPRRQSVNFFIIENLTKILKQTLYIKLHPLERAENYKEFKSIKFIEDFNKAIQSNICISRKSTILLEAVYNQSKSIALLVDPQDKFEFENIFPALLDTRIYKCFSFEKLIKQLNKN